MGIFRRIFGGKGKASGDGAEAQEQGLVKHGEHGLEGRLSRPGERHRERPGLEAFARISADLLARFERDFDPNDRSRTEDIYRQAKRLSVLFQGPGSDVAYSGIFGEAESGMGKADIAKRNQRMPEETARIEQFIAELDQVLEGIESVVGAGALEAVPGPIEPLKPGHKKGVRPDDLPSTQHYQDQLDASFRRTHGLVGALRDLGDVGAILRREDLQALSSAHRSLGLDVQFWKALHNDVSNPDPNFYNDGFWPAFDGIPRQHLDPICDAFERAYSKDGLSEADRGAEWLFGKRQAASLEDLAADLDGDHVPLQNELEKLTEQPPLFKVLGVFPKDLVGLTEAQISVLLKRKYYKQAKTCHPDLFPGDKEKEDQFKELDQAYDTLRDPARRSIYLRGRA